MNKKSVKSLVYGLVSIILLVLIDQISKYLAIANLKGKASVTVIPHIISLTYLENPGSAWGILKNMQWLVVVFSVIILGFIIFYYTKLPQEKKYIPLKITMTMLAAGAAGNAVDRIARGVVVDFLEFKFISFPVFNVADIYVTVSVAVLFILLLFVYKEEELINRKA